MGLQVGVEADSGPDYSVAVWAGECSGGGFGLDLFGGCSLLSEFAFVLCSMVEISVVKCGTLTDSVSPGPPVCCHILPGSKVNVALLQVCFKVVLKSLLLASRGPFPFN